MQDYLCYGEEARMNRPSTGEGNWRWRLLPGEFTPELQQKIRNAARRYGRA
jgi:4-alpha-glucanotransferase